MIIEAIVSTRSENGELNFAPVGVRFHDNKRIELHVYHSSHTYRNLVANRSGVANLLSDVLPFVKVTLSDHVPEHSMSGVSAGGVMESADEAVEFTIDTVEDQEIKSVMSGPVVSRVKLKSPTAGINRGRGAVIEALIVVTRIGLLPDDEIEETLKRCCKIVDKTGGPEERKSMSMIESHYERRQR